MCSAKQTKRKLSESLTELRYDEKSADSRTGVGEYGRIEEAVSPLSDSASPAQARDDDLVTAAAALTSLNSGLSPSPESYPLTPRVASPLSSAQTPNQGQEIHPIVQSVNSISRIPLVSNAVKYYETSKRNYATFNYAAGIVEKAAIPVINKIEVNLNSIHQARLEGRALRKKRKVNKRPNDKTDVKKRIKFCLHILKLANEHISTKVNGLQQKMQETDGEGSSATHNSQIDPQTNQHAAPLNSIAHTDAAVSKTPSMEEVAKVQTTRGPTDNVSFASNELTPTPSAVPEQAEETNTEVVDTVKKIIHVISNFRPSSLNGEGQDVTTSEDVKLKSTIREIILNLPQKVSSASNVQKPNYQDKAFIFAKESLDMISRLTVVFNEQLEKAETWVDGNNGDQNMDSPQESVDGADKEPEVASAIKKEEPDAVLTEKRFSI